jgi:anthranilate/para-aminobenzoate synthase component II
MKATFIDFEDSFSYNVVQELTRGGFKVEVLNWKDYEDHPTEGLLVLGPGPGHPDDYLKIFPLVRDWLELKRPFFGVCLGHQIFWRLNGALVVRSKEPLHGQKVRLKLSSDWSEWLGVPHEIFVQRYNSLCVPSASARMSPELSNLVQNEEILMTRSSKAITYQFHPESIGTSYRKSFFGVLSSIMAE